MENVTTSAMPVHQNVADPTLVAVILNSTENSTQDTNGTVTQSVLDAQEQLVLSQEQMLSAILVPIFFGIIFCVGIVGNSLVITVMMKIYRYQAQGLNNTNRFILNLAIADLLFLVFCVPFQATIYSMDGWPFGAFMCVFCEICQKVAMLASIYTLVALSFDRFFAVVYATSAKQLRTRANATRGIIFIWVASIGIAIPSALTRVQFEYEGIQLCLPNWRMRHWDKWYQLSIFILGYVLPLLVILSCYVGVLYAMCKNAHNNSAIVRNKSANDSRKRVTRIVVMVVVVFAIDWFPHHLTSLWVNFGSFPFTPETFVLKVAAHCLSYANSCVNPLVYAFVSNRFRSDFKRAFTCQYLSEAVVNMKAYSRRMVRSLSVHLRSRTNSQNRNENQPQEVLKPRPPTITSSNCRASSSIEDTNGRKYYRDYASANEPSTSIMLLTPSLPVRGDVKPAGLVLSLLNEVDESTECSVNGKNPYCPKVGSEMGESDKEAENENLLGDTEPLSLLSHPEENEHRKGVAMSSV